MKLLNLKGKNGKLKKSHLHRQLKQLTLAHFPSMCVYWMLLCLHYFIYYDFLQVVGQENYKVLLTICESLMAKEILKLEEKHGDSAPFKKCQNETANLLQQLNDDGC